MVTKTDIPKCYGRKTFGKMPVGKRSSEHSSNKMPAGYKTLYRYKPIKHITACRFSNTTTEHGVSGIEILQGFTKF